MQGKMEPASRCVRGGASFKYSPSEMNHQPLSSMLLTREVCIAVSLNCAVLGEQKCQAPKGTEQLVSEMGFLLLKEGGAGKVSSSGPVPPGSPGGLKEEACRGAMEVRSQETKRKIVYLNPLFWSVSQGIRGKQKPPENEASTSFVSPQTLTRKPGWLAGVKNK